MPIILLFIGRRVFRVSSELLVKVVLFNFLKICVSIHVSTVSNNVIISCLCVAAFHAIRNKLHTKYKCTITSHIKSEYTTIE